MTPAVPEKQTWRRQTPPGEAVATATLPEAQTSDTSMVLELLMDLLSHMSATKEYIAQQKEADNVQTSARLVALWCTQKQPLQTTPRRTPPRWRNK